MTIRDIPLVEFEHLVNFAFMEMEDKGLHVDREYSEGYLSDTFTRRHKKAKEICLDAGIENINSTKQVANCLIEHGAELTKKTKTGYSTDKEVMADLILEHSADSDIGRLAQAVQDGKSALGFKTKYVDKVIRALDANGRVHPSHMSLQARTARTAVSDPPLHQLPSRDNPGGNPWEVRRMFDAIPGHSIIACDFDQIELIVLAALCGDRNLIEAIRNGIDLHQKTADAAGMPRGVGKLTNFLIVYGGGAVELVRRAKMNGFIITQQDAERTIRAFHRLYPGVKRLSKQIISAFHAGRKFIRTPTNRVLPIDRHRVYAGLNYIIQSTARDIMAQGCVNLRERGLWKYVILTVHDEYILEVPTNKAKEIGEEVVDTIQVINLLDKGINITSGTSEPVPTWGHLYLEDGELMPV